MTYSDRAVHEGVMREALAAVNELPGGPFVLKGGTALALFYGLDRFSEDVDLDAEPAAASHSLLDGALRALSERRGFDLICRKDSETTQRYMLHYGTSSFLKVEASYRTRSIDPGSVAVVDGTRVYTIDRLCELKCGAYAHRDKLRDLYDVTYICTSFYDELGASARAALYNALIYKDIDQFDYLVSTQGDPLIDADLLETRFLESLDAVGLLCDGREARAQRGARAEARGPGAPAAPQDAARRPPRR